MEAIFVEAVFVLKPADLHHLAAEPDEDRRGNVRMRSVAPKNAFQIVEAVAGVSHAATGAVRERDRAVNMRVGVKHAGMVDPVGDHADHSRGAVHGGAEGDVVPRTDAAVGAAEALEGRFRRVAILHRLEVDADMVVLVVASHRAIVDVDMRAGRNVVGGVADDLAEFQNRRALGDFLRRHLVAHRHGLQDVHILAFDFRSGRKRDDCDHDVVVGVEPHEAALRGGWRRRADGGERPEILFFAHGIHASR